MSTLMSRAAYSLGYAFLHSVFEIGYEFSLDKKF